MIQSLQLLAYDSKKTALMTQELNARGGGGKKMKRQQQLINDFSKVFLYSAQLLCSHVCMNEDVDDMCLQT